MASTPKDSCANLFKHQPTRIHQGLPKNRRLDKEPIARCVTQVHKITLSCRQLLMVDDIKASGIIMSTRHALGKIGSPCEELQVLELLTGTMGKHVCFVAGLTTGCLFLLECPHVKVASNLSHFVRPKE